MSDPRENPNAKAELDKAMGRKATSGDPDSKPTGVSAAAPAAPAKEDVDHETMRDTLKRWLGIGGKDPSTIGGMNPATKALSDGAAQAPGNGEYGG